MFQEKKQINNPESDQLDRVDRDQGWEKSRKNKLINSLLEGKNLAEIMLNWPNLEEYFCDLDTIDCSDGRVLSGHKMGIAGSGLLLSPEERADFIARFKGKIKTVTSHRDCGAAALKFSTLKKEGVVVNVDNSDDYGTQEAKKIAAELGAEHKFIEMEDMTSEYHNEVALVVDATGHFDSTNLPDFPAHFSVTGAGLGFSQDYVTSEIKILTDIAFGHHGFGSRFSSDNPFCIMVVADNQKGLDEWKDRAKKSLTDFGDKIHIDSFLRPQSK